MTEEREVPIGSPTKPIPNVGVDVHLTISDGDRLVLEYNGEEYELVADDGLELREASDEK